MIVDRYVVDRCVILVNGVMMIINEIKDILPFVYGVMSIVDRES